MSWSWSSSCGRQSVDQFVWVSGLPLGSLTRFYLALLFSFDNYVIWLSMRPLWRENRSVIYCTIASGPCQSNHTWAEVPQISDHILLSHRRLPQPGGPGSRIYVPQEQGSPVIPPGTGLEAVYFLLRNIYKFNSYLTGSTIHLLCVARLSSHM
jgi:hypothetical protein